ncbi:SNARE domain-containing protein [Colletotrichum lupini]|uniref:SNARE domain-containing protein n=1 Tax=Colletotrichum lupini TaxID=145971 RepID=A0A9Q8SB19_9PEZI|nr:SNARE domain-containing protein [Colletotrichum lupini]UQC74131.1 SNARE domain-containing protein [Colletotrichum lupini]
MAQRFGASSLHQRDSRSALFEGYTGGGSDNGRRPVSASPSRLGGGYGYGYAGGSASPAPPMGGSHLGVDANRGFRPATPNKRGQYSDAVLNELESQNDEQVAGIMGKVKILKSMTVAIGDEIRDSSALAEKMNDSFDSTRLRIRGTMNRMLVMAEKTGVGWKSVACIDDYDYDIDETKAKGDTRGLSVMSGRRAWLWIASYKFGTIQARRGERPSATWALPRLST